MNGILRDIERVNPAEWQWNEHRDTLSNPSLIYAFYICENKRVLLIEFSDFLSHSDRVILFRKIKKILFKLQKEEENAILREIYKKYNW